jgi:hypothetical protein
MARRFGCGHTLREVAHTQNSVLLLFSAADSGPDLFRPSKAGRAASPLLALGFRTYQFCRPAAGRSGSASAGPFSLWATASLHLRDSVIAGRRPATCRSVRSNWALLAPSLLLRLQRMRGLKDGTGALSGHSSSIVQCGEGLTIRVSVL